MERLAPFFSGEQPLDKSVLRSSGEIAINIICDIELDLGRRELGWLGSRSPGQG